MSLANNYCYVCRKYACQCPGPNQPPILKLADDITDIRNQLWIVTEEMPMTRKQMKDIEIVKDRLWTVQEKLRELQNEPR